MERISSSQLADRLDASIGLVPDAPLTDPLLVVDLRDREGHDTPAMAGRLAAALRGLPVVAVALVEASGGHPLEEVFDVVLTDDADLAPVQDAVAAHPVAAVALAVLLRGSGDRSPVDGLVAESATYSLLQAGPDHRGWLAGRASRPESVSASGRPAVRAVRTGNQLHLTLDRPDVRNAFNAQMRDELLESFRIALVDPEVQVLLDAAGPSFCSGGDLNEFGTLPDPATAHIIRLARSVGRAIASVADRVTVHVHGSCVGAGIELPAFAGHVVADPGARFSLPELSMGLVPGAGGTVSITRRIGRQRTAELALTGRVIDTATALSWGLVDSTATRVDGSD